MCEGHLRPERDHLDVVQGALTKCNYMYMYQMLRTMHFNTLFQIQNILQSEGKF